MRHPRLLIALLLAASVLVDLAVLMAARPPEVGNINLMVVLVGLQAGQVSLIAIWLALGRTPGWLRLMATVAVIAAWERALRCADPAASECWLEFSAALVIAVAVPLLVARLLGLQLVNVALEAKAEQPGARRRFQFTILDLLGWMTAVAVTLGMFKLMWLGARLAPVSRNSAFVVVIGTAATVALAGLWAVLGTRRFPLRVVFMLMFFVAICEAEVFLLAHDWQICSGWLILTLLGSLAVVRVAGYRIVRAATFPPLPPGTQSGGV